MDQRSKNGDWSTVTTENTYESDKHYARASLAVLMDIRDELQTLNSVLGCTNFQQVPSILRQIRDKGHRTYLEAVKTRKNTTKRPYVRKVTP